MPVTKTAKRALRVSKRKSVINDELRKRLEISIRKTRKNPIAKNIKDSISLIDRAAKKNLFHKNKAARMKSTLSKLGSNKNKATKKK